jgi:uncharacterized protein (DUF983 family)
MNRPPPSEESVRPLGLAILRGFRGKCPRCGRGQLLARYISPIAECTSCGEHLAPYQTADFAPYIVTFAIGLIFTPVAVAVSMSRYTSNWLVALLLLAAIASALLLLPRAKGGAIALLWALDIQVNQ